MRDGKGGIDWYRYQNEVLRLKLLPFAQGYKERRPSTVVIEDNAPLHMHHYQSTVYSTFNIERIIWLGNLPDLNMIKPCWFHLKRRTTQAWAPSIHDELVKKWEEKWAKFEQEQIQRWVERVRHHIQEVVQLHGDNLYQEGRAKPNTTQS